MLRSLYRNWRRKWQPTPVFLPGESHGGRSLVGYSPRGGKELDTTELLFLSFFLSFSTGIKDLTCQLPRMFQEDNFELLVPFGCSQLVKATTEVTKSFFFFFSSESSLHIMWPKYWSFSISPSNEYSGLISLRIDWFDLPATQEMLKSLLQHHTLKLYSSVLSILYGPTLTSVHDN